jgi:hypothetical protein
MSGSCARPECCYPRSGIPKQISRALFATIHLQYIATHYCATADKTYMPWFRTIDLQMANGEKVEIARDRTAAETDVAMRKVMDGRLIAARELEMQKTVAAAPRLRDEVSHLVKCAADGMSAWKQANPQATQADMEFEYFLQHRCVQQSTGLRRAAGIAGEAAYLLQGQPAAHHHQRQPLPLSGAHHAATIPPSGPPDPTAQSVCSTHADGFGWGSGLNGALAGDR